MLANTPDEGHHLAASASIPQGSLPTSEPTITREACMNCGGGDLKLIIDLGRQPNGNHFIDRSQIGSEPTYSMRMVTCTTCWQVQIDEFPSQEVLFSDHPYVSGLNVPVVEHFKNLAGKAVADFALKKGDVVLDIGCNDGSLLSAFREHGMTTIGVDPGGRVNQLARQNGHMACRAFWNLETARSIRQLNVKPKVISATAVFYHVPDLHDFVAGLTTVMQEDTVFVVQGVNLLDLIEKREFDHFYHEHSCIHSVGGLERLFAAHDMRLLDVNHYDIHGGSFVAYVVKNGHPQTSSDRVSKAIAAEREAGLEKLSTYLDFAEAVRQNVHDLKELLSRLKEEGKTVFGLGAPLKGSTLLNYGDIGPDLVACLTEVNEYKIGKLSPGTHVPVVDERTLDSQPDYYLILAWNFLDFFMDKKRDYLEAGGKFIVSVPSVQIFDKSHLADNTIKSRSIQVNPTRKAA